MAIYTVHEPSRLSGNLARDADRFMFVRDGFYGWAFLLAPLWMLRYRLWLVLLGYLIVAGALHVGMYLAGTPVGAQALAAFLLAVLIGTEGGTLRRFGAMRRRYRQVGVVVADDLEAAERRFFATWDVLQGAPRGRARVALRDRRAPPMGSNDIVGLFPQPGGSR